MSGPAWLWAFTGLSTLLMVSHIRFAHFGRVILKETPKPLFFLMSAAVIVALAYLLKTKNAQMFGYMILGSAAMYLVAGRIWIRQNGNC